MAKRVKKCCAVCGDTFPTNVRLRWRRDRDGLIFDICCYCAEQDKVNEVSVDNFGPSPDQEV